MKNSVVMYEKVYEILKNKIESGVIPHGSKLPSRANLCKHFDTSEKTIRRAVELLVQEGLVETTKRKRTIVAFDRSTKQVDRKFQRLEKVDAFIVNDIFQTVILFCYPLNAHGISLCTGVEWEIPEAILNSMDPGSPAEFWRLSKRFWRFFIARNENELILQAVDSLGFSDLNPLPGTWEIRSSYQKSLRELIRTVKCGGNPVSVPFDDFSILYGLSNPEIGTPVCRVNPDSPLRTGSKDLEQKFYRMYERYSSVYLDLLGRIAIGLYRTGDRLPSHDELRRAYGVSIDTTIRAIQTLQEWGVVTAKRGKGIYATMDLDGLKKIPIDPEGIACHVRRFLDNLELLSLTIENTAAHAAAQVTPEEARQLHKKMEIFWNDSRIHQHSPTILLDFITEHIRYDTLRAIYRIVQKNYRIGRGIPHLVNRSKTQTGAAIYQHCLKAANFLVEQDAKQFAKAAAGIFQHTHQIIIDECKRLGYWESATRVYDGSALWK